MSIKKNILGKIFNFIEKIYVKKDPVLWQTKRIRIRAKMLWIRQIVWSDKRR